ncbi:UMP kinase [Candidatus Bathyarchaeota archaeon]|nr:UMP kinase [Candidatus Bathyarchaeota archaeon]MBS7628518.1 UMP kinase [Candidatus Bathyarchaeota archaeon]
MKLVVKAGGYLFPSEIDTGDIRRFAAVMRQLRSRGHDIVIVTGGGFKARQYIEAVRRLGGDEAYCDEVGIRFARLNALLLISSLGDDAYPDVPETLQRLRAYHQHGKIVVLGGLQPGQSTNAVAALAAETVGADMLINATDVDGVYLKDPKKDPSARRLEEVSVKDLMRIVLDEKVEAGGYKLFDPIAIKIIERSKIPTWILNGRDPENILRVVEGGKVGTRVTF